MSNVLFRLGLSAKMPIGPDDRREPVGTPPLCLRAYSTGVRPWSGARVGDEVLWQRPVGDQLIEVLRIEAET